jgi:REP element-mobilizing transposase RayT
MHSYLKEKTMARGFRVESPGIYHVLNRGVEKRDVFLERSDYEKFLRLLKENKVEFDFHVLAYCFMPNHYHLLLQTKSENLSAAIKSQNQMYAQYFNRKYERVGGLWQGRFKSRLVRDNKYLKTLFKYIEQNPIKAGIAAKIGEYPWASAVTKDIALNPEDNELLKEFFGADKREKSSKELGVGGSGDICFKGEERRAPPEMPLSQHFMEADLMKAAIGLWRGKRNARSRRRFRDGGSSSEPSGRPSGQSSQEYGDSRRSQLACQLRAAKDKAILSALRDGYSGKQISCYLGVSPSAISKRLRVNVRGQTPLID